MTAEQLLVAAQHRPRRVRDLAWVRLQDDRAERGPIETLRLWWAIGLAERELGDWSAARVALERALDLAVETPDRQLAAGVQSSLAFVIAHDGELDAALALLARAEPFVTGIERARLIAQRGVLHLRRGRLDAAAADLTAACRAQVRLGDRLAEARTRVNLGNLLSQQGRHGTARRHLETAARLATALGQDVAAATARHNLAWVATVQGDTPAALDYYARAEREYRRTGAVAHLARLHGDHARTLADAHLLADAQALLERALEVVEGSSNALDAADLALTSAEILLARGDSEAARACAEQAATRLRAQGRERWADLAEQVVLQARIGGGDSTVEVVDALSANSELLAVHGWRSESLRGILIAARVDAQAGRTDRTAEALARVRPALARVRRVDRILLADVQALMHEAHGERAAARRAIGRGLRVAAGLQAELGSLEARAHAAAHGYSLTEQGARLAVADRRPRELLHRIEATRLMMSSQPLLRPPDDEAMAEHLAELRQLAQLLGDGERSPAEHRAADARRLSVEAAVRRHTRTARSTVFGRPADSLEDEMRAATATLGHRQLVAHAALDGRLLAVTLDRRRARLHDLGSIESLRVSIDTLGFALHRLNRTSGSPASRAAASTLLQLTAAELGDVVLPPDVIGRDGPLVVVPTGVLHGVPWGALPQLVGRELSISPSFTGWAIARDRARASDPARGPSFVAGPDLEFAEREVRRLARAYDHPAVAIGQRATSARCVALLGSSHVAHLACHGTFRADNPLFSTLRLVDGPVNVYDLERSSAMPRTVVLSACSAGTSTATQGGTLLGLASALMAFGASSIVAPLSPVNDEQVVEVMVRLHDGLRSGLEPAVALARARTEPGAIDPTAAAFVVIGA